MYQTGGHFLTNVVTNSMMYLPDHITFINVHTGQKIITEVVIQAAALSASPRREDCLAAALVEPLDGLFNDRRLMIWRFDRDHDGISSYGPAFLAVDMVDLIFFDDSFYFLTNDEQLVTISPAQLPVGATELQGEPRKLMVQTDHNVYNPDFMVYQRYLCASRGRLHMVTRLGDGTDTAQVVLFRLTSLPNDNAPQLRWTVDELAGRMLFLSPGCSRAYEVNDFPGAAEGVFFKDDTPHGEEMLELTQFDRTEMTKDAGICAAPPNGPCDHFFELPPQLHGTCPHSASVWVLCGHP
ncbi:hypothetical protein ACP4OV_029949 [Aristida adscensionis]